MTAPASPGVALLRITTLLWFGLVCVAPFLCSGADEISWILLAGVALLVAREEPADA